MLIYDIQFYAPSSDFSEMATFPVRFHTSSLAKRSYTEWEKVSWAAWPQCHSSSCLAKIHMYNSIGLHTPTVNQNCSDQGQIHTTVYTQHWTKTTLIEVTNTHNSTQEFEWSGQWQWRLLWRTHESDLHLCNRIVHCLQHEGVAVWNLD